ncbi:protein-tyrosine phosphatase domain-containing protein [Ditylenchus destructor]|uniref:Protein-tyrosine phosphatase domain-containing protein n=1 Tax=Ditylenchus destructor TaxID=166010 RepID=A0AAD4NMJ1_9BILA|nr:protein-tyrosine phosphatase domain-containing protein [Ditylenchus destructor]
MVVLLGSLTGTDGNPKMKCFFPSPKQERQYFRGKLRLRCSSKDQERDHDFYSFTLLGSGQRSKNAFQVHMLQNRKWIEDKDVPDNLLDFRAVMQIHMARAINEDRADGPVLFVCPTGVHRCGTFAVLNILSDRLKEEKKVGLDETLAIVRSQRYGVVAHFDHYKVLHELTVRQAVSFGMVDTSAVGGGRRR